ncbi:hypothetical protein Tco_0466008 [Tanacetum coccineum]
MSYHTSTRKKVFGTTLNVANPSTTSLLAKQASKTTESESIVKSATDGSTIGSNAVIRSQPFSNKDLDGNGYSLKDKKLKQNGQNRARNGKA